MKIAMIGLRAVGQDAGGGIELAVEEISTRLASREHQVTVFCRNRYNPKRVAEYKGVRLVNLPAIYTKHLEAISHTFLASLMAMSGYDIVHFHATGPSLLSFIPRITSRKTVATVHGLDWRREKWQGAAKLVLKMGAWAAGKIPHKTIVVSKQLQRFYRETYARETEYIPNGVPPANPMPVRQLNRFGVKGDDYVLFLGRLVPEKGCHLLIEAFQQLETAQKLLIVGASGYTEDYAQALRKKAEGDARIVFTGPLYGQDKAEALSNATCLAMPSTLEGMPIVMLEGMAHSCPVVCSDIPEHLEIVDPSNLGADSAPYAYTFTRGSTEDLKRKLEICLQAPEIRKKRASQAKDFVLNNFSWDFITNQTEAVYLSLCEA